MEDPGIDTIEACRRGDVQAFAAVVAHYERPLFSYVYRLLHGKPIGMEAEDVVQEVFLKTYRQAHTFDPARGSRFTSWIFAIARNHCISLLRQSKPNRSIDMESDELERIADESLPSPHDAACRNELAEAVAEAVAALDEPFKSAFILRHYEEMPYEEIAAVMECSVGAAKSRVFRARDRLAKQLCSSPSVSEGLDRGGPSCKTS